MGGKNSRIYERISRSKNELEDENDVIEPLPEPAAPEPTDPRLPLINTTGLQIKKVVEGNKEENGSNRNRIVYQVFCLIITIIVLWLSLVIR